MTSWGFVEHHLKRTDGKQIIYREPQNVSSYYSIGFVSNSNMKINVYHWITFISIFHGANIINTFSVNFFEKYLFAQN